MGLFGSFLGASIVAGRRASQTTAARIHDWVKNSQTKREIRQLYKDVSNANFANRGVYLLPGGQSKEGLKLISQKDENDIYDYKVDNKKEAGINFVYGRSDEPEGMIVSGGNAEERAVALIPFIFKAKNKGVPIITVHYGNAKLERILSQWSNKYESISPNACFYDAFRGMATEDIAYILHQSMPDSYATSAASTLLQAVAEVMDYTEESITLESLANFQILNMGNIISDLYNKHVIDQSEYQRLNNYFMAGAAELNTVRMYLSNLNREAANVYGKNNRRQSNVRSILNQSGTLSFDLGRPGNELLTSLVISHISFLQNNGKKFVLLLDELPLSKYTRINDLLRNCTYAISGNDFNSLISAGQVSKEELFTQITGSVTCTVLFAHSSGLSCEKWSDYMGKYKKIRIRSNINQTTAYANNSYSKGISVDESDEPRVPPGTLTILPKGWACIYSSEGILFAEINEPN